MSEFRCTECRDVAPELALDVLTGRTRARAVAHLSDCAPCLEMVSSLALVADRLVELLPEVEPPAGFGDRVVTRVALSEEPAPRRPVPVASALVTLLLTAVAWALGANGGGAGDLTGHAGVRQPTVLYAPLKVGAQQVGGAFLYPGDPGWIHVSLHTDLLPPDGTVRCDVVGTDGTPGVVGEFRMAGGRAEWEGRTPIDTRAVTGATVSDLAGRTVSTARFERVPGSAQRQQTARPVRGRPAGLTDEVGNPRGYPEARRSESDGGGIERDGARAVPSPDHPRPGADRDTSRPVPDPDHPRTVPGPDHPRTVPGPDHPRPVADRDRRRRDSGPARTGGDTGAGGADRAQGRTEARPLSPRPTVRSTSPSRARRAPAREPDRPAQRAQRARTESSSGQARSGGAAGGGSRSTRAPDRRPVEVQGTDRHGRGRTADTARSGSGERDVERNAPRKRPTRSADSSDEDD